MELIELLNTRGIEYKKTNNPSEILISCTSGLHNDSNPSLSYNLDKIFSIAGVVALVVAHLNSWKVLVK